MPSDVSTPTRRRVLGLIAMLPALPAAGTPPASAASDSGRGYVPPPRRWPGADAYPGWAPPQVDGCDVLFVDDVPQYVEDVIPAAGPLERFTARPGAWYSAVFIPLRPAAPVQLWLWQRARTHALHLLALDAPPGAAPAVAVPLPVRPQPSGGRGSARVSAPFALPAASGADGIYVLIEQWSVAGDRPGPLWAQARSRLVRESQRAPWWSSRPDPEGPLAPDAPPSPLRSARGHDDVIELPILQRAGAPLPRFDPWGLR